MLFAVPLLCVIAPAAPPGLSAAEILQRSQRAYDGVKSLIVDARGSTDTFSGTAHIVFQRPGKLKVTGTAMGGKPYALVSSGGKTWVLSAAGSWEPTSSVEMGIARITGISMNAGTAVPAALFHTAWGQGLTYDKSQKAAVSTSTVGGRAAYVVRRTMAGGTPPIVESMWIDQKTFFLLQTQTTIMGRKLAVAFGPTKANVALPKKAFDR